MVSTPFDRIPKTRVLIQIAAPAFGLLCFFFMCAGVVANSVSFQQPTGPVAAIPFWEAFYRKTGEFFFHLVHIPDGCMGRILNEFQAQQCELFWWELFRESLLLIVPIILVVGMIGMSLNEVTRLYKQVQRRIQKKKSAFVGVVTDPSGAPGDLLSWFYCLRPTILQLENLQQVRVYIPLEAPPPIPGEKFVAFEIATQGPKKQYAAMLYTPHVAIVRGE